jgi:hypothetical protein
MDVRAIITIAAILCAASASAQQIRTASGPQPAPKYEPKRKQPLNLGATPMKCDQFPDPRFRVLCNGIERDYVQDTARRQGLPVPSAELVKLPAMSSPEAKRLGAACIGGTAMRRLSNGWEQLRNVEGHWIRCREQ